MGLYHRSPQVSFLDPEMALVIRPLNPISFEVRFRTTCDELLPDSLFADLYSVNGRPAISPSALSRLLMLQLRHGCSDREAVDNLFYDPRWRYMCDLPLDKCEIHPTTLTKFRLRLMFGTLDREQIDRMKAEGVVLQDTPAYGHLRSLVDAAVTLKILDPKDVQGIDSTAILGAAAVQDSYRLMFQGLQVAIRAHEQVATPEAHSALLAGLRRQEYTTERQKPEIDWQDAPARRALLDDYLEDTLTVLVAGRALANPQVNEALVQLAKLVGQDLDLSSGQVALKQGVAPDRQCSVVDKEMRHGRKSASKRFNGFKAHGTVEPKSGLITAVEVTPASVHDGAAAEVLVEEAAAAVVVGDNAYAGADVREQAMDAGVAILTPTAPGQPFEKDGFALDVEASTLTCPAKETARIAPSGRAHFAAKACRACPFAAQCNPKGNGRTVEIHRAEELQRQLRALARTEEGQALVRQVRAATERIMAHWVRWGLREGRYFGTLKTGLQAVLAALGHNLDKIGRHRSRRTGVERPNQGIEAAGAALQGLLPGRSTRFGCWVHQIRCPRRSWQCAHV